MTYCKQSGKQQFATASQAAKQGASHRGGRAEYRPYRCPHCSQWHLTKIKTELRPKARWAKLAFEAPH
jgi:hypothetical protein